MVYNLLSRKGHLTRSFVPGDTISVSHPRSQQGFENERSQTGVWERVLLSILALVGLLLPIEPRAFAAEGDSSEFKAGVAVKVVNSKEALWMAGYAGRKKPAEGKVHDLKVKVLALQDAKGKKLVLLTSDLLGLSRSLADQIAAEVIKKSNLSREQIMLTSSHTHCGPVLGGLLSDMYEMPPEQPKMI